MSDSHTTVVIIDPGIKNENGYPAYDQGLKENAFIKVLTSLLSLSLSLYSFPHLPLPPLPLFPPLTHRIKMAMYSLVRCGLETQHSLIS